MTTLAIRRRAERGKQTENDDRDELMYYILHIKFLEFTLKTIFICQYLNKSQ